MAQLIQAWRDGALVAVEKLEVHRLGLKHPAVSVFVMDGDRVLLQRRAETKYHTPGLWANTCCTHPLWGESAGDCATRRLREELGIEGVVPVFRDRIEYRADVGDGLVEHEVVDICTAEATRALVLAPDPAEVMDTRWTPLDALRREVGQAPDAFTPWLRIYLDAHSDRIFGGSRAPEA